MQIDSEGNSISSFLMFEGDAEEAVQFYVSISTRSKIESLIKYGAAGPGKEGSVQLCRFEMNGQSFTAFDSPVQHAFKFTPALSLFVSAKSKRSRPALQRTLTRRRILMPLDTYPFAERYAWLTDRFCVSWQLPARQSVVDPP